MATAVVMPKAGNTVESCIIVDWTKSVGEQVSEGDILCEIETDKATMEVESPVSGTLLARFFEAGDEVPVLVNIAAVGEPGEAVDDLRPAGAARSAPAAPPAAEPTPETAVPTPVDGAAGPTDSEAGVSPRARNLARQKGVDVAGLAGSGPGGRIIERDVQAALQKQPAMTPLARSMVAQGGYTAPSRGSGSGGRILAEDLQPAQPAAPQVQPQPAPAGEEEVLVIPVKGVRKLIAERMLQSLLTTAQLTLNGSAEARALQAYRARLKASSEELGLQKVTINDLVLFAVSRTLTRYPELNALYQDNSIHQYKAVHLAFAVDTPRGLMVPVIRQAHTLSLKQIAGEARRLAAACLEGGVTPDELSGGTFTVTNLGSFGVESFTPVLNPPQVGILGVSNINLKPVEVNGEVKFVPHLGLSLTINHQVVDGAPAARFLQALSQGLAQLDLLLAL